jgi:MFS family permease
MELPTKHALRKITWSFAVAETVVWAAFYYAFPALLTEWERDLGWSKMELSSAFTTALVLSALLAPVAGRLIDLGYAFRVYLGCALLGAVMLALLSFVREFWQFFAVWIGIGLAMSGALYEACFAIITRAAGQHSKQAITRITLVAGLAGTVSFPAAHTLSDLLGWRSAIQIFAGAVVIIAVPLIWYGCRAAKDQLRALKSDKQDNPAPSQNVLRSGVFWFLAISFTAISIDHGMLLTHFLPIMDDRGMSPDIAVFAASMIGPMQVTGRIVMIMAERRVSIFGIAIGCFLSIIVAGGALLGATGLLPLIFMFVILHGAGYGVTSIVRPVITAELLGRKNFGTISGMLAVPFMFGAACAPTFSALVWSYGGYDMVIKLTMFISAVGLLALLAARRSARKLS